MRLHRGLRTPADGRPLEAVTLLERLGLAIEIALYVAGGFFLVAAAVIVLIEAVPALWQGGNPSARVSLILDRVLLVFVLVEVFHTLRLARRAGAAARLHGRLGVRPLPGASPPGLSRARRGFRRSVPG